MGRVKKAKVLKTHVTSEGTLYKDSIVRVETISENFIRVKDEVGKIFHVNSKDIIYI